MRQTPDTEKFIGEPSVCDSNVVQALIQSGKAKLKSELGLKCNPNFIPTLAFRDSFCPAMLYKNKHPPYTYKERKANYAIKIPNLPLPFSFFFRFSFTF